MGNSGKKDKTLKVDPSRRGSRYLFPPTNFSSLLTSCSKPALPSSKNRHKLAARPSMLLFDPPLAPPRTDFVPDRGGGAVGAEGSNGGKGRDWEEERRCESSA